MIYTARDPMTRLSQ